MFQITADRPFSFLALGLAAVFFPALLYAQHAHSGPDAAATVDTTQSASDSSTAGAPSDWSLTYFGIYNGPSLGYPNNVGSVNSSSGQFDPESLQYLKNEFRLDYNLSRDVFVGPIVDFNYTPLGDSPLKLLDSGVRIGDKKLIYAGDLNVSADLRLLAPLNTSSRALGEWGAIESLHILTYSAPKSKVTFGVIGKGTYQIYGSGVTQQTSPSGTTVVPKDFHYYLAPYVSYQLVRGLSAAVYYEMYPYHSLGAGAARWSADPADISPGLSWDVTRSINVSPQLLIYPSHLSGDALGSVVYVNMKLF